MKRLKLNRWLISFFLLFMMLLVFTPEEKVAPTFIKTNLPDSDYFMEGIIVHQYNSLGKQINAFSANRLEHSSINDVAILDKPVITFNKNDTGKWKLYSNKGRLLNNSTMIELEHKVIIEEHVDNANLNIGNLTDKLVAKYANKNTPEPKTQTSITTYDLTINLEKNIASTPQSVLIKSPFYQTQSKGLHIEFDKEIITLSSNVSTEIYQ